MGVLHWPPSAFWDATPYDMRIAIAGWKKANGVKDEVAHTSLTREDIDELRTMMNAEKARDKANAKN